MAGSPPGSGASHERTGVIAFMAAPSIHDRGQEGAARFGVVSAAHQRHRHNDLHALAEAPAEERGTPDRHEEGERLIVHRTGAEDEELKVELALGNRVVEEPES